MAPTNPFSAAWIAGLERMAGWSDLLDAINVYPVADGDTGRNLVLSLSPLRIVDDRLDQRLLMAARGNSGNIAVQFLLAFTRANDWQQLVAATEMGRNQAWQAMPSPKKGTMLSIFDTFTANLNGSKTPVSAQQAVEWIDAMAQCVRQTRLELPDLRQAGVVDAGALGMFLFFEGFLAQVSGLEQSLKPVSDRFAGLLKVAGGYQAAAEDAYCVDLVVDLVVDLDPQHASDLDHLRSLDEEAIVIRDGQRAKIHLHTQDRQKIQAAVDRLGTIVRWHDEHIGRQMDAFAVPHTDQPVHIMTDAAGSLTRSDASQLQVTLLDSYIQIGAEATPETRLDADQLYSAMIQGTRVSTSQASVFERHNRYEAVLARHATVLYLCVGSVFTGNFEVATAWRKANDPDGRMQIMDTGAASGRLGVIALAAARRAARGDTLGEVREFAQKAIETAEEYVFLERLKYLAAGGRLSKTSAFFGDALHMKPIISPTPEGAKKVGLAKKPADQIRFALDRLSRKLTPDATPLIMLEYSDNRQWVDDTVRPRIASTFSKAEILLQPLSLTSGAHMGPGTWGVAFLP